MIPRKFIVLLFALLFAACTQKEPVRIGLIGGFSSHTSDVALEGRNGLILAVEEYNKQQGNIGRPIELVVFDDNGDASKARQDVASLLNTKVAAIVGPFTSAMVSAVLPLANAAHVVLISPTANSMDFVGKEDYFIRMNRSARENATDYAQLLLKHGQRRMSVAYDVRNKSFSESWLNEFRKAYEANGGAIVAQVPFVSRTDVSFGDVLRQMLRGQPDGLLFVAGAVDVALLAQQATKLAPKLPKSTTEWAASASLIELGGQAAEGMLVAHAYNQNDESERYRSFYNAYVTRFGLSPSFSSLAAYDSATVMIEAIRKQQPGESLRDAILKYGPYQGVQQSIAFDSFGDSRRSLHFTKINQGRFVVLN